MPMSIDSKTELRRQQLSKMLGDTARGKTNGLKESDARKQLAKTPSISDAQAALMTSLFEDGSQKNDLDENKAWKLVASHRGTINPEQLRVATAIIKEGKKDNGLGELPALQHVLKATSLNARQADVLLYILRNGGNKDWDFVTITGNKRLGGTHFGNWALQQTINKPELTAFQAACVKKLVELTKGQVSSPELRKRFNQLFEYPPKTQSEVDARIATYLSIR